MRREASPLHGAIRWPWWAIAAAAALLSASEWLHAPSVEYLVPFVVATVAAAVFAFRLDAPERKWALGCAVLLAATVLETIPAERNLWLVRHEWSRWRHDAAARGLDALRHALDDATHDAAEAAVAGLSIPENRAAAFDRAGKLVRGADERGLVVMRGDTALAWAGVIRPALDLSREGVGIVATPFYLALQVLQRRGDISSVAVVLLDAEAPADRLSSPLARRVAADAGLSGFTFAPPSDSAPSPERLQYTINGQRLFDVRADSLMQGEVQQRIEERVRGRAGVVFVGALALFIIGVWRGARTLAQRVAALGVGLACTALVPLSQYSNLTRLFDPGIYFTPNGGPLTGNAGALATTSALVLLGVLAVLRRHGQRLSRWGAAITVVLVAGLGPFLLRELARGVQVPLHGVDASLWLIWEVPLFLAAVSVLLAGAVAGGALLGSRRGLPPSVAPVIATLAAVLAHPVWEAPGRWPWWYTFLWIAAIAMLALSRRSRYVILSASTVAALGATTLVWGRTARGRVDAATRDLASLSQTDSLALTLIKRFGSSLAGDYSPVTRQSLLQHYVTSDIAPAGNPVSLSAWPTDSGPVARFATARIPEPIADVADLVALARRERSVIVQPVPTDTALELVMAAPGIDGGVTAVVLAPRSRLFETDPFAKLLGLDVDSDAEPPYTVRLRDVTGADTSGVPVTWRRRGSELHGDWVARTGRGLAPVHVEVELRPLNALVQRGALIVALDLAIVGMLWLAAVIADGGAGRWFRARRRTWARSYRARLTLALFAFFVIPAIAFAIWSYEQLATDATQSRALLVSATLRALSPPDLSIWLASESDRLDTPLLLYHEGQLQDASDELLRDLAPIGRFLPPPVALEFANDEETVTRLEDVGSTRALFGFRAFDTPRSPSTAVAAPARADELQLGRRRRDLGVLVLFATGVGALAALWLSGIAARELARPVGSLSKAALSIAGGVRTPRFDAEPTVEFRPVFAAFRRMAADLAASRGALEDAQRRTAAVLRNVASGVVAVDPAGRVSLANPRAEALLDSALPPDSEFAVHAPRAIADIVARFLASTSDDEGFELSLEQQQLRGTLTRLQNGGAVLTVDDVTELARAQRVLAWGEMARQVAHEIKNPLTPIRLGVQHLRRARADARVDFDRVLDQNVNQILAEIDRLDEIARAFSRYGAAPEERRRAAPVDVAGVVREVVSLERMGQESAIAWEEHGVDAPMYAYARADELKEVLLNVLENARHANATRVGVVLAPPENGTEMVAIVVRDNGHGIPADVLPRIFEPHFSTRTSGSGLGLAISRQLVEGWGGEISVESADGKGAAVEIRLRHAPRVLSS